MTITGLLVIISGILNTVLPILILAIVIYIIVGIIKYATADSSDKQNEGRRYALNGVIVLFVIVSLWGLVAILNNTFGINQGGGPADIPCVPGTPGANC